jgi:hypothetical protein
MSTHERDPNASGGCSPSEDIEHSGSFADKGSRRKTRQAIRKRSDVKHAATRSHDDSLDDFVQPPTRAKKITTAKRSKKGGGQKKKGIVKMAISKSQGAKKVS